MTDFEIDWQKVEKILRHHAHEPTVLYLGVVISHLKEEFEKLEDAFEAYVKKEAQK
jgi:hypothetical protein